jgi:hypothetical protein
VGRDSGSWAPDGVWSAMGKRAAAGDRRIRSADGRHDINERELNSGSPDLCRAYADDVRRLGRPTDSQRSCQLSTLGAEGLGCGPALSAFEGNGELADTCGPKCSEDMYDIHPDLASLGRPYP